MLAKSIGLAVSPWTWLPSAASSVVEANLPQHSDQALEEYQRLARYGEDTLVPSPIAASAVPSIQARRLAHARARAVPASLLRAYRTRVDGPARRLLREGQAERDPVPLRNLVDEYFCSRYGEEALDLLGDLAFERGQFAEARHWWSLLVQPGEDSHHLHFPAAKIDPALVRAKMILARIFQRQTVEASQDVKDFRPARAGQGALAGRSGVLAEILADELVRARPFGDDPDWATFGGSVTRQQVLARATSVRLWADGPTWRRPLPGSGDLMQPRVGRRYQPVMHPIIVEDQVLLNDCRSVVSYHLPTGNYSWQYKLKSAELADSRPGRCQAVSRLFPVLHSFGLRRSTLRSPGPASSAAGRERHELPRMSGFAAAAPGRARTRTVAGCRVLARGARRIASGRGRSRLHDREPDGRPANAHVHRLFRRPLRPARWSRPVCDAEAEVSETPRASHHLMTLAGGQLVYCSHAGAIVAVDPWSGRRCGGARIRAETSVPKRCCPAAPPRAYFTAIGSTSLRLTAIASTVWTRPTAPSFGNGRWTSSTCSAWPGIDSSSPPPPA